MAQTLLLPTWLTLLLFSPTSSSYVPEASWSSMDRLHYPHIFQPWKVGPA